ncbi:unnamed protein product [Paramecium sonneborni]|uniref:Uncharacterized protein n=1 Tax=Paramecium sonneborni TaxID=65129 RepID=A0A8S1QVY6_9CILI|nr:unnamed protein product [Paramecium sonneborni]
MKSDTTDCCTLVYQYSFPSRLQSCLFINKTIYIKTPLKLKLKTLNKMHQQHQLTLVTESINLKCSNERFNLGGGIYNNSRQSSNNRTVQ